jgi:acetyl-CoA carboxylase carboxyltransferase component
LIISLDAKSKSIEIGAFAGDGMYDDYGGCPSGGVVVKIGYIKGKQCIVVANDATVKGRRLVSHYRQEKSARAGNSHRESSYLLFTL